MFKLQNMLSRPLFILSLQIELNGKVSSQYLTAILMAAPLAEGEGYIEIICNDLISQPYVEMTVQLMGYFNVEVVSTFSCLESYLWLCHVKIKPPCMPAFGPLWAKDSHLEISSTDVSSNP